VSEISDKKTKYLAKLFERVLVLEWGSTAGRVNALGIMLSAVISLILGLGNFGDWILELAAILKGAEPITESNGSGYLIPSYVASPLILLGGTFVCMYIIMSIEKR